MWDDVRSYRFPLATVMRIRQLEERLALEELLVVQRELRRSQDAYRAASDALEDRAALGAPVVSDELRWRYDQTARLSAAAQVLADRLLATASHRDEVALSWKDARQRAEILARLNLDARAQWRASVARAETAEADDVTTARRSWTGAPR